MSAQWLFKILTPEEVQTFANNVINRFSNPFIQHQWLSITLQYSGKIKQRCGPLILKHYSQHAQPPMHMALGFAAYILFMKVVVVSNNQFYGERNGEQYVIKDGKAAYFYELWQNNNAEEVVHTTLAATSLWGEDLSTLPGLTNAVLQYLNELQSNQSLTVLLSLQ